MRMASATATKSFVFDKIGKTVSASTGAASMRAEQVPTPKARLCSLWMIAIEAAGIFHA